MSQQHARPEDFARLYRIFEAPISRFDCGRRCSPLNGGEPVCCSTEHAVPVVDRAEWELLRSRTSLWRRYRPTDRAGRSIVADLAKSCLAIECKGVRHCERDNRTLACRSFPFFPYIDSKGAFIGLSVHWTFLDRCWVISNFGIVDTEFRRQFIAAYDYLFEIDPDELRTHKDYSAAMRRVFSRRRQPIPFMDREGRCYRILPHGRGMRPCAPEAMPRYGPYRSGRAYRAAVRAAGGTVGSL
ncbi:MAG TPA: hypothetical protein VFA23_17480 [Dongiaceae bacterium]|nr:hypothetical protein [Dongiaceae bacterium]